MFKSEDAEVVVAVEAGTHKVAAAVAEVRPDGSIILLGVGEAPSSGIRKGEVVDFQLANQSIRNALIDAEKKTDAEVNEVYLALTGSHIMARTVLVRTTIDNDDKIVTREHVEELNDLARNQAIPRDHAIIHELLQHYYLDDKTVCSDPVGLTSQTLEGSYHLVHGWHSRLETTVRSLVEQSIEVRGYALSAYAAAQAVISQEQKDLGAVMLDIGAGTTDYIVYVNGAVMHTGAVGVGGDHLTQDLALGLKLPFAKAEELKLKHGDLYLDGYPENDKILMERELNFDEREIYRESMTKILYVRQRELFELINSEIESRGLWPQVRGNLFLTGGSARIRNLTRMAEEVFPIKPKMAQELPFEGDQAFSRRPELATVLGLLVYAHKWERTHAKPTGWERIRRSVHNMLAALGMF